MSLIYKKMIAISQEIGSIGKEKKNAAQGFKYRGIDDFYNVIQPLMSKHGVFCTPKILSRDTREAITTKGSKLTYTVLTVEYDFYAEDGSLVSCSACGEGMDSGDKSTNKAMAIAHKYALMQIFCVPTEESSAHDPDAESHEVSAYDLNSDLCTLKSCEEVDELKMLYTELIKKWTKYDSAKKTINEITSVQKAMILNKKEKEDGKEAA